MTLALGLPVSVSADDKASVEHESPSEEGGFTILLITILLLTCINTLDYGFILMAMGVFIDPFWGHNP